jgi:hypothetical protein
MSQQIIIVTMQPFTDIAHMSSVTASCLRFQWLLAYACACARLCAVVREFTRESGGGIAACAAPTAATALHWVESASLEKSQ